MSERAEALDRLSTGVPGLDDILHGGWIPNRLYLVEGIPGSGKTTLALQFLLDGIRRGDSGLYITLSETKEELIANAAPHGWDLSGLDIVELAPPEKDLKNDSQAMMYHPAEIELNETTRLLFEAVEKSNPHRVAFDSLSELRLLAQDSLRYRRQILALKQFFSGRRCTVLLLDDRTSDSPDMQLQSIAQGVLSLEQLAPVYGAARRRLRVSKYRGTDFRAGFHDFSIERGGLVVYPRLVAADHRGDFPRHPIKSDVERLDTLLGGGLDRGTSTLLLGPAGVGKSTVALQYTVAATRRDEHAKLFAFDESVANIRARASTLGIEFREGSGPGEVAIQPIDPAEMSPGQFAHLVRQAVEQDDAKIVVIDSLNGYLNAMPEEQFLTAQLHELLTYLGHRGVTTLMVAAQHGLFGDTISSAGIDTSYLADCVILFRYFEHAGEVKKAMSVVKKRTGPHERTIRELTFSSQGIQLSEPLRQFRGVLTGVPDQASQSGQ